MTGHLLERIPELDAQNSIKIAPNTSVPVTERLLALIDAPAFQRLRKIRQLSLSEKVFPSATHTRFSHALGVYKNVIDYTRHLHHRFPEFRDQFEDRDYLGLILAGLLHDLGHYPCSHQLDHLDPFPAHEELTIALIHGEMKLDGIDFGELIRQKFAIEPEDITRFLGKPEQLEPRLRILQQIIDSPIDADKCDYLPRDSYYCGVDYGTGFDRERFIANLVPRGDQLCIHEKGLMSAERFQLARYWMYRSVYWGHTVRSFITMLGRACEYLIPGYDSGWPERLLDFNDHNFLEWLHQHMKSPGRELIEMVHHRREPYKRVYTVSFHHNPKWYDVLQGEAVRKNINGAIEGWASARGHRLEDHHLIWDVPPLYKSRRWESFPIVLSSGGESPIDRESPVIEALSNAFLYGVRKIRLFCHPALAELRNADDRDFPDLSDLIDPGS